MLQGSKTIYAGLCCFVGFLSIALFLLIFFEFSDACELAQSIETVRSSYPHWCLEFWVNRYQTFLGVFAAIGAAYIAWLGLRVQKSTQQLQQAREYLIDLRTVQSRNKRIVKVSLELMTPVRIKARFNSRKRNFDGHIRALESDLDDISGLYETRNSLALLYRRMIIPPHPSAELEGLRLSVRQGASIAKRFHRTIKRTVERAGENGSFQQAAIEIIELRSVEIVEAKRAIETSAIAANAALDIEIARISARVHALSAEHNFL